MTKPIRCDYCQDVGIIELAGTVKIHGITYSRGSAPCRWCDEGRRLRDFLEAERQHPLTDYSVHSLAVTPDGYHHTEPHHDQED